MRVDKMLTKQQLDECFRLPNVVLIGYGYKMKNGCLESDKTKCLVFGVVKKVPEAELSKEDVIQSSYGLYKTDVVEVGELRALADRKAKHRPAFPGISLGHLNVTAGTFGCVVRNSNGERTILSNNHVMANSNQANIGDSIIQPGTADGGSGVDAIATLEDFVPITFEDENPPGQCPFAKLLVQVANFFSKFLGRKTRLSIAKTYSSPMAVNTVDAAIARPVSLGDTVDDILEIGMPTGAIVEPELGMELQKSGRTTGLTTGTILQTGAVVRISYGANKIATFVDQIVAGPMSAGGDSGSAVLDMNRNYVGLLFAGSSASTIINPMQAVFDGLGLTA